MDVIVDLRPYELPTREVGTRLRTGLPYCLVVFSILRFGMWLVSLVGSGLIPKGGVGGSYAPLRAPATGWQIAFSALQRNDADWFLRLAIQGYTRNSAGAAFFPGYPLAIRALAFIGHPVLVATLVSNLAFLGSLVVLYSLATLEFSEGVARTTVLLVAFFPTAFFFLAPYSESLFLLLSLLAFWSARRDRWVLAFICAAAAALTRAIGIMLVPALVFEAYLQWKERGVALFPRLLAASGAAVGSLSYFAYWWLRDGDFMTPLQAQSGWDRHVQAPWTTIYQAIRMSFDIHASARGYLGMDLVVTSAILIPAALGVKKLRGSYVVYMWASLLLPLVDPYPLQPLVSDPRFVLVIFPAFWIVADWIEEGRLSRAPLMAVSITALVVLTLLFINSYSIF